MSSSKLNYFSIGKTIDGTNYCSGVETLAENIIEDNEEDAVLVFPSATGWAGLRPSSYKSTTENQQAILPLPIYKIKSIKLNMASLGVFLSTGDINNYKNSNGETLKELDITKYVIPSEEWKALPLATGDLNSYNYVDGVYKQNTFYYEKEGNTIPFLGSVYEITGNWFEGDSAPDKQATYRRVLRSALRTEGKGYTYPKSDTYEDLSDVVKQYGVLIVNDIWDWTYRIEYVPLTSKTKIRARKSEKQEVEYLQPFNQRAEVNAASAFGQNMWLTAQKTGTRQITVVKNYTRLADIPPLGSLVKHNGKKYRLVANSYKITNTIYVQVTHTLSENWTSKSKHVSVNQKYRNYKIPLDILWRNLYWEDYVIVSGRILSYNGMPSIDISNVAKIFTASITEDKTIDVFCWLFKDSASTTAMVEQIGVTVPCSTYGIANSIVISASFKDNLSAGLKRVDDDTTLCEETLYCNANGTLENARVVLSDGIGSSIYTVNGGFIENEFLSGAFETINSSVYPAIYQYPKLNLDKEYTNVTINAPKTPLFNREFYIGKDPGEALKFTYQVHFVTENDCVVGNKIAENNPLIKRHSTSRQFKVWLLKSHIREGVDKLETTNNDTSFTQTSDGEYFTCTPKLGQPAVKIALNPATRWELINKLNGYKAWAITDENNNLYVGRNENEEGVVYLCMSHRRS